MSETWRWKHGPTVNFLRDGKIVDQLLFDRPTTEAEALDSYLRWHPLSRVNEARTV